VEWGEDAEGLPGGLDVMNAKDVGAFAHAVGEEGEGAGVSICGVGEV